MTTGLLTREHQLGDLQARAGDERILTGTVVPYDTPARIGGYTETFARSAFGDTAPGVSLTVAHQAAELPIGAATQLRDEPTRLAGEFHLSETRAADEVLTLARDGVALGLSVRFQPIQSRWSSDRRQVTRQRARLADVSVVGVPAYAGATVDGVRSRQAATVPLLTLTLRDRP